MKNIFDYVDYRKFLNDYYQEKKLCNTNFSHRFIERRISVSDGYFSRILKGEKNVSDTLILKLAQFLKLGKKESVYFECLVKYSQAKDPNTRAMYYARLLEHGPEVFQKSLAREQFAFFQESYHVVIHGLINIVKIKPDTDLSEIGKMLIPPLTIKKIKESIKLLTVLGLIELNKQGYYQLTGQQLTTGNNPKEETLRKFLIDSFMGASNAVNTIPEQERSSAIMTITVSENGFSAVKEKLAFVRKEINQIIGKDKDVNRVYQVGMYMIPKTDKIAKRENDE